MEIQRITDTDDARRRGWSRAKARVQLREWLQEVEDEPLYRGGDGPPPLLRGRKQQFSSTLQESWYRSP